MFDFVKNLNLKLNNVLGIKDKKVNNGVPYVADLELEEEISAWLKAVGLDNFSFGLVLLKLGFNPEQTLYLKGDKDSEKLIINYGYENKIEENKIMTLYESYSFWESNYGSIIISDGDCKKYYYSSKHAEIEDDFAIVNVEEIITKKMDGVTIISDYRGTQIIKTIKKDDGLEFELKYKSNYVLKLNNELELEQYLLSLNLPVDIFLVYKKICEIVFDNGINNYNLELTFKKGEEVLASLKDYSPYTGHSLINDERKFEIKDSNRNIFYNRYLPSRYTTVLWGEDSYSLKMIIKNGYYEFKLAVRPVELNNTSYKLDNELEVRDYLLGLEFPIKIEEVFKKLCEISFGDISRYSLIKLDCSYKDKIVTSLHIRDGKFNFYKVTKDDKEITIDSDGNFIYKSNNKERSYLIEISGNTIKKYEYVSDRGIDMDTDNRMENPLNKVINDVKEEKVRTRKLIDEIVK